LAPDECHPQTRIALLNDIYKWVDDAGSPSVFWLQGKAGTGKSTISQTVAKRTSSLGALGASFFFKRGEGLRDKAARLFSTIAHQLAQRLPFLSQHLVEAIEEDPDINHKNIKKQFETLILDPLKKIKLDPAGNMSPVTLVVVIDAIDECDSDEDVRIVIDQLPHLDEISWVRLKCFITSRPNIPILAGFHQITGSYKLVILHEVGEDVIKADISVYLQSELSKTRDAYNRISPICPLDSDWPGQTNLGALVEMAFPLFIFAKTVCRFVENYRSGDPDAQMKKIFQYRELRSKGQEFHLHATYLPMLEQMLRDPSKQEDDGRFEEDRNSILEEFRDIVGTIITLADSLPIASLARLIEKEKRVVGHRLNTLQSVLNVPTDPEAPVKLFHLSFRDFLVNPEKNDFCIDEVKTHERLMERCLLLLSKNLKQDIAGLSEPAKLRSEMDQQRVRESLASDIQYACLYWVHHLTKSGKRIRDGDAVHTFLSEHFLHWLEVLSLLGKTSDSIGLIDTLRYLVEVRFAVSLPYGQGFILIRIAGRQQR
jgi:hypothetical protein